MHRASWFIVLALVLVPVAAFGDMRISVPGGTPLKVRMVDSISSGSATPGETFSFKADGDVVVNGWVVVAKDAPGQGEIVSVEHAGPHGHSGNLGVKFNYIYAVDGEKVRLSSTNAKHQGANKGGASSTATLASTILLGPVGLLAHNMVRGHDVVLDSSRTLDAFVDGTVHIAAKNHSSQDPNSGYAH